MDSLDAIREHLDATTVVSLTAVLLLLNASYTLSRSVLPPTTPRPFRILFVWHAFDFLIHSILEGAFLYNCFFTYTTFPSSFSHSIPTPATLSMHTNFLGHPERVYGAAHGDNWATKLWMVYARADTRWGEADVTLISLELLTVLVAGPMALWICRGIQRKDFMVNFWMVVLASGELYGGFMTFAPEWLTASTNLDTSNALFLWFYLVFFNGLWVVLPLYAMYVAYGEMKNAFLVRNGVVQARLALQREREGKEEKEE